MRNCIPFITWSLILCASAVIADDVYDSKGNLLYTNASILRVEPDGISYRVPNGIVKVKFSDLPDEEQQKYGYKPRTALTYKQNRQRAINRRTAERNQILAAERVRHARRLEQIREKEKSQERATSSQYRKPSTGYRKIGERMQSKPGYTALGQRPVCSGDSRSTPSTVAGSYSKGQNYPPSSAPEEFTGGWSSGFEGAEHMQRSAPEEFTGGWSSGSSGFEGAERMQRQMTAQHINALTPNINALSGADPIAAGHLSIQLSGQAHSSGMHETGHALQNIGNNILTVPSYDPVHDALQVPHIIQTDPFLP